MLEKKAQDLEKEVLMVAERRFRLSICIANGVVARLTLRQDFERLLRH
jgi:hypothetical protein